MRLVRRLRDLAPRVVHLRDQLLLQRLRVLLLLHEVPHHEDDLLGLLGPEELEVELEDDLEDLELRALEGADLLNPDVDEEGVRDGEGEERVPPLNFGAFLSLVGVAALDVEDDDVGGRFDAEPDALGGLPHALLAVEHVEVGAEERVEQRALARALRTDDRQDLVLLVVQPVRLLG